METIIKYVTKFTLTHPVLDLYAAQSYLTADNMTEYLEDDLDDSCSYFQIPMSHLKDKIISITWNLVNERGGQIELLTTEEIPQSELDQISDWVLGQCSDGLGEGFEQQDFASYEDEEDAADWEDGEEFPDLYEDHWIMASFDWQTNKYYFHRDESFKG